MKKLYFEVDSLRPRHGEGEMEKYKNNKDTLKKCDNGMLDIEELLSTEYERLRCAAVLQ